MNERQKLLAETQALKAQREQAATEAAARKAGHEAQQKADATSFSNRRLRASLGRFTLPAFVVLLMVAGVLWLAEHDADVSHPPDLLVPRAGLLCAAAAVLGWRFAGPLRHRRWVAGLPFPVTGLTEALGGGQAVRTAHIDVVFADTRAPIEVVRELVQAKLPPIEDRDPVVVSERDRGFLLSVEFFREASNFPLARWFPRLATQVLARVHVGFPIARVTVIPAEVDEFYVPSGD